MNDFARGFLILMTAAFLLGGFFVTMAWMTTSWLVPNEVRSEKLLKPKIELVLKNNKVDTIYIYKDEK